MIFLHAPDFTALRSLLGLNAASLRPVGGAVGRQLSVSHRQKNFFFFSIFSSMFGKSNDKTVFTRLLIHRKWNRKCHISSEEDEGEDEEQNSEEDEGRYVSSWSFLLEGEEFDAASKSMR